MTNHLLQRGKTWHVKVAIPADVQPVFNKRAFKKSLKTSDKAVAIARSGPLIIQYKQMIEEARGNPTQHLDEYLEATQSLIRKTKRDPNADPAAIEGLQDEVLSRIVTSHGVQRPEQLTSHQEAEVIRTYKLADGQLTRFGKHLEDHIARRKVEAKTAEKDRHAVTKFASRYAMVEDVDRQAVKDFINHLHEDEGLKVRTIKDNISTLRVYWRFLVEEGVAPEDRPNPFDRPPLPAVNRKDAAEKTRLPFSISDVHVRRQGFWVQRRPKLRESLAHLVGLIMRRVACDASGAFRVSFV